MKIKHTLIILAALSMTAGTAAADSYNLRGPAPEVGDSVRSEQVVEMTDGEMDVDAGGMKLAGTVESVMRTTIETTVMEMDDDTVSKVEIRYVSSTQKQTMEMMGQKNTTDTDDPLHGKTVVGTNKDGVWSFEIKDGTTTAMQRTYLQALAKNYTFSRTASIYPDREVEVGETWDVDAADLPAHYGAGAGEVDGTVTMKLDKVEETDGEQLAHLTMVIDNTAVVPVEGQGKGTMTIKGDGTIVRSLKTYLDKSSELTGTMRVHMQQNEDASMTMSGNMKMTVAESNLD